MSIKFKTYPLDGICRLQMGKTPKREKGEYWGEGFPWVSIADMKGKFIETTKEQITAKAVDESGCKMIRKGTLLMSFKLSIGKLGFAATDLFTNEAIVAFLIRDYNEVYPEYLYYVLKTLPLAGRNKAAKGSTLNTKSLKKIQVPIPEKFEEQVRIAKFLGKFEELIEARETTVIQLNEILKSSFLKMFGTFPNFTENATIKSLKEVCEFKGGGTPSKSKPEYFKGEIPWVSPKDMKSLYITSSKDKITKQAILESSTSLIPKGAVLMVVRSGILKNKLPVAINLVDVAINQDMKAFNSQELISEYLLYFFISNETFILKKVRATFADNFDFDDIKNLRINVPPINLQNKFKRITEKVEVIKRDCINSLAELNELFNSSSQRIFGGQINLNRLDVKVEMQSVFELVESTLLIEEEKKQKRRPRTTKVGNLTLTNYYENEFATLINKHFKKFHFRFKEIEEMFAEEGGVITYFTTQELKLMKERAPKDIQSFIFDCVEKKNKNLKLNQIFYDALSDLPLKKIKLKAGNETLLLQINNKEISREDLSGIYFQIAK